METLILKEEWAIKCNNCGCDSHCETRTTRTEHMNVRNHTIKNYYLRIREEQKNI